MESVTESLHSQAQASEPESVIDEGKLQQLIQAAQSEFPNIDPYFIYTLAVDHLLQEQGIMPDKDVVEEMIEKSKTSECKIEIVEPEYTDHGWVEEDNDDSDDDSDDDDLDDE